jgi:hypothetical protein
MTETHTSQRGPIQMVYYYGDEDFGATIAAAIEAGRGSRLEEAIAIAVGAGYRAIRDDAGGDERVAAQYHGERPYMDVAGPVSV